MNKKSFFIKTQSILPYSFRVIYHGKSIGVIVKKYYIHILSWQLFGVTHTRMKLTNYSTLILRKIVCITTFSSYLHHTEKIFEYLNHFKFEQTLMIILQLFSCSQIMT